VGDAEAIAAREAIKLAGEIGVLDVEVEGDSLSVCNALKLGKAEFASYGNIIDEIHLIASSFHCISFSHVKRAGNCAAHILARQALDSQDDFVVWLEDAPPFLINVIQSELAQF
jgi:ribonuclease HI